LRFTIGASFIKYGLSVRLLNCT